MPLGEKALVYPTDPTPIALLLRGASGESGACCCLPVGFKGVWALGALLSRAGSFPERREGAHGTVKGGELVAGMSG